MDEERTLGLFERLVAIESPSWSESAMAQACTQELEQLGFTVRMDGSAKSTGSDTGNLIAYRPGSAKGQLMFSAHMDTVKPCQAIEVIRVSDERGDVLCSAADTFKNGCQIGRAHV